MKDILGRENRKLPDIKCLKCGVIFKPRSSKAKYCSRVCAWSNNGGHNAGTGSGWINQKGYREIKVNGVTKKEHRVIMEAHIGRALLPNEDVHHINGVKTDNRISNLEIIDHSKHTLHHNSLRDYKSGYCLSLSDDERLSRSNRAKDRHRCGELMPPQSRAALSKARGES